MVGWLILREVHLVVLLVYLLIYDLIFCIDSIIEDQIVQEIKNCTFLSTQIDEATVVSTKEQLSIIIRLDSNGDIVERLLRFVDVSADRTAASISSVVKSILEPDSDNADL